jgi:hypothetical protein
VSQIGKACDLYGRKVISFCALRARVPVYYSPSIIPGADAFTAGHYTLDLRLHPWDTIIPPAVAFTAGHYTFDLMLHPWDAGSVLFSGKNLPEFYI